MPVTTNLGATPDDHRAMLEHLITIGRALNAVPETWARGDASQPDLTQIVGIGPAFEQELNRNGIATLGQLAAMDDETMTALEPAPGITRENLRDWIEQAKDIDRTAISPEALAYRAAVSECRRVKVDSGGAANKVLSTGKTARVVGFDLFDAPESHEASASLKTALREFIWASDGTPRVPDLTPQQLATLDAVRDTLQRGTVITDKMMGEVNQALEGADVKLRRQADPKQNEPDVYQTLPAAPSEPNRASDSYDPVDQVLQPSAYQSADTALQNRAQGDQYDQVDRVLDPSAHQSAESALRRGAAGVRAEGSGLHPAARHEEAQSSGEDGEAEREAPQREGAAPDTEDSGEAEAEREL